jgi:hypothetical protein
MTRAEYEDNLTKLGIDPDFPIQIGRRYKVTGFSDSEPLRAMCVWVSEITPEHIEGHIRNTDGVHTVYGSKWAKSMASRWTWTEMEHWR